jgi:hypothetical protein
LSDPSAKTGPLTFADLQAVWDSSVDRSYREPMEAAGEGQGFEAYTQMFAQFARAAQAIDTSFQAMYIKPWSGQTGPPAAGGQKATVQLTFARTKFLDRGVRVGAGLVFVLEETTDWGTDGPQVVTTGRRYLLLQDAIFLPGEMGPITVTAQAEFTGYGYNNPRPGTLKLLEQAGSGFNNSLATVTVTPGVVGPPPNPPRTVTLIGLNQPDMFVPDQIGQYVQFTAGVNAGSVARINAFLAPRPLDFPPAGSSAVLELFAVVESFAGVVGAFTPGEIVKIKSGVTLVGEGIFVASHAGAGTHVKVSFDLAFGVLAQGDTLTGSLSGATATADVVLNNPTFTAEAPVLGVGGASWRVLDWFVDLGVTVTNVLSPTGGLAPMLDELGRERNLPRANNEPDVVYRQRVGEIADVVTPNAIRRTLNRVLGTIPWCFREVGSALLPGFYFDRLGDPHGDFYDTDVLLWTGALTGVFITQEKIEYRNAANQLQASGYFGGFVGGNLVMIRKTGPANTSVSAGDFVLGLQSGAKWTVAAITTPLNMDQFRWHVLFDYLDFRAFFLVGVPPSDSGDPGFAYDNHPRGAYDASPVNDFYDGFPIGNSQTLRQVWQAINAIRAGGVSFDLYVETGSCT